MPSVVIAAHNEASVIDACLRALARQQVPDLEVYVVANGCTDRTAEVAARPGVTVVDRPEPGKAGALNAGDQVATSLPRIYLDADIVVPDRGVSELLTRLAEPPYPLAAVPRRRINLLARPWPVRAYMSISERIPAFRNGLFGRGMIALSAEGRARFDGFPDLIADDLFLDSQFSDAEKAVADGVEVVVEAPYTTRDLLNRLVRVRRGNAELRAAAAEGLVGSAVRPTDRWAWLRDVVLPDPRLAVAAIPYVFLTVTAAVLARRQTPAGHNTWGRDESTRGGAAPGAGGAR